MKISSGLLIAFGALSLQSISLLADASNSQRSPFFIVDKKPVPIAEHPMPLTIETKEKALPITMPAVEQQHQPKKELKHRFQIGADYTHVSIKPRGHQSFNGSLGGVQAMYEYRPVNFFYGAGKVSWKEGPTSNSTGSRSFFYVDVQERLGYTFACDRENTIVSVFSGFGYRHHGHHFEPKQGKSTHFYYNEFYFPVGWVTNFTINSWFSFGLDLTWMPQIFSTVGIVPLKGARWDLKCSLANFAVELPLNFTLTKNKRFTLILKPFYEYWKDGHSTARASSGEALGLPSNTYNFWGVDLNIAYCF